jgi:hypothetical protein
MQIFVKTLNGKSIALEVTQDATILDIKRKVFEREGVAIDAQNILYGGKTLEDTDTLGANNIQNTSTLHLVIRLKGGARTE